MAHPVKIPVQIRSRLGKGGARELRRQGKIPAVVYGPDTPAVHLALDPHPVIHLLESGAAENVLLELKTPDGKSWTCLLKAFQLDPVHHQLQHADFYAIKQGVTLTVHVPIRLVGESPGVKAGGILEFSLRDMEVECLPKDIPESIEVDISQLDVNDYIQVRDVQLPKGVKAVTDPDAVVVLVAAARAYEEEEEAAAEEEILAETPEPEVIRKGKEEEAGEETEEE